MSMSLNVNEFEDFIFDMIDQVKVLFSQELWENILLNSTKNEVLILFLLYRKTSVNMSQIADYIGAPLNTVTGIVTRMEKKAMVERLRSAEDKRVVTIVLTSGGQEQIQTMIQTALTYGQKVMTTLTAEELDLLGQVVQKIIMTLKEEYQPVVAPKTTIRKIEIE